MSEAHTPEPAMGSAPSEEGMSALENGRAQGGVRRGRGVGRFLNYYGVVLALVVFVVFFSVLLPHTFFSTGNFVTMLTSQAVLLIVALGLTIPLSTGEFDLSIGSVVAFAGVMLAVLTGNLHWPTYLALLVVAVAGVIVGVVNGMFVVAFGVNAFIATLGTSTVLAGLTLAVSGGQIVSLGSQGITSFANAQLAGFSTPVFVAFAIAFALWYVYEHTPVGRYLFFVGEGREVARLAGIRVGRLRWGAFIASALLCTLAGTLAVGNLGAAVPSVGGSYLLPAFAAAFLGATTLRPGRFNAWGTVVALYLLETGVTGLQLLGASSWVEQVFNGSALVVAVTFARFASRNEVGS
jgi:ribose transport system permease protein